MARPSPTSTWKYSESVLTFDLPRGYYYDLELFVGDSDDPDVPTEVLGVTLHGPRGDRSGLIVDRRTGEEYSRYIFPGFPEDHPNHVGRPSHEGCNAVFDELVDSIRME